MGGAGPWGRVARGLTAGAIAIAGLIVSLQTEAATASVSSAHTAHAVKSDKATATKSIRVSDRQNGHTIVVTSGRKIDISLSSTYWKFGTMPNPAVLRPLGPQTEHPAPVNACVPGAGCGAVSIEYLAVHRGRASVVASRNSCGEGAGCSLAQSTFRITIVVKTAKG